MSKRTAVNLAHRPSQLGLARTPSRDLTRHGCRVQGCTCGVSCEGGRARAVQQSCRSTALRLSYRKDSAARLQTSRSYSPARNCVGEQPAWRAK
ncbi:hypothetical protein XarbCFBP8138_17405 [Xanthomonas arboricola]|nr:hypothetical protein XarbCFBP8138_17405 [Xanthomonas arboricola]